MLPPLPSFNINQSQAPIEESRMGKHRKRSQETTPVPAPLLKWLNDDLEQVPPSLWATCLRNLYQILAGPTATISTSNPYFGALLLGMQPPEALRTKSAYT